jgi:hypothetical protein
MEEHRNWPNILHGHCEQCHDGSMLAENKPAYNIYVKCQKKYIRGSERVELHGGT